MYVHKLWGGNHVQLNVFTLNKNYRNWKNFKCSMQLSHQKLVTTGMTRKYSFKITPQNDVIDLYVCETILKQYEGNIQSKLKQHCPASSKIYKNKCNYHMQVSCSLTRSCVNRVSCLEYKSSMWLEFFKKYLGSDLIIGVRECKHIQHKQDLSFKIISEVAFSLEK